MLKVSDAFNSAFSAPDRELRARVTIGKTVYDSDDLTSINYDSGAMTGEQFSIGSTYMNSAKIIFSHLVEGLKQLDEVLVEFGVLKPDGTVEYVKMGTFIVDDKIQMDRNNNTTTIECMDRMTMLGGAYVSKLTYPARIKDVAVEIANMAGVKANETSFARLSENKINQPTGYTYRDAIGLIAQFQMGFALFDRDGLLDIRTLQDNSFKIDPNQYFLKGLVKNETFFKLNGISCTVVTTSKDENGNETSKTTVLQSGSSSGAQIKLANNVMTQDVLDRMYEALKFTNYYPFSLNWNGNPAVEAGDWLTVEDLQGNEFKVPNMSYTLTYNGGLTTTSKADTSVSSPATYSYGGSMSNIVNEIGGREGAEGNHIYEGTEDQKPLFPKEGDLWYKHVGPDTEEWIYKDGKWEFLTSTKTANDAADAADKASKEAEEAKKQANKAVDGANDAVAKAGFANDTATQAKSDAAAAGQQAKDALTSAGTAITDAKKALTDSGSAMADSTQARKDSATAKIQATNAATQANQAVTDASTAKADANTAKANATQAINDAATAKGQAANALGQANTAINNAANALDKFNNMSVGGRNYLLGSATVTPVDNQHNWAVVANKSTDTFNGLTVTEGAGTWSAMKYSLIWLYATAPINLQDEYTASIWIRNTSTQDNVPIRFYCDASDKSGTLTTYLPAKSDWVRISQTFRFNKTSDQLTWSMRIRFENPVGITTGDGFTQQAGFKLEKGNQATDWSPAPEDVQQQFTDINGELSQKVSQTTYNVLAGTVDTVSTLAKQNQSTISTLATKNSVDTVNHTATAAQTLAQQNATELLNKANSTTVNTLTQRVTTAESTLSQTATKAELALTKTDVDKLGDSVASQALDIAATADGLKLKADSSTISDLAGTVAQNSAQLGLTATKADLALTQNDVNDLDDTVNKQATQLALTATKAELQVAQTNVDNLKKTVTSNTAGMTANANAIKLKADSSTVSSLDGRVTNLSGQLDVQADKIAATVTASDVTGMLGNYATQTWTQSQIKSTADSINLSVTKVQSNLDNLSIGGRNYLLDTNTPWQTRGSGGTNQTSSWLFTFGAIKQAPFNDGDYVTVSFDYINVGTGAYGTMLPQFNNMPWGQFGVTDAMKDNGHVVRTVQWKSDWTTSGTATGIQTRMDNVATTRTVTVYNMQFERGNKDTDHKAAPEDMATVEKLSELQVTVNGIQGTVQNKADKSQITQLADQISLKADTTALNELKGTVDKQGSEITLNTNSIKLKADQSSVNTLKGTVDKQGSAIDVNTKAIALKANQSTVDTLTGRVSTAEGKITVQADQIAQTVSKTELTTKLNGYATQTWTQSQIKTTADQINLSVTKVQTNLDNMQIEDRNLYPRTKTMSGYDIKGNAAVIQLNGEYVTDVKADWSASWTKVTIVKDKRYQWSLDYRSDVSSKLDLRIYVSPIGQATVVGDNIATSVTAYWQRARGTFVASFSGEAMIRSEVVNGDWATLKHVYTRHIKLSQSDKDTGWSEAPEDSITDIEFSELHVTVNGIQGTVQNKADKSQVTQLAGQITSVVGDVSANSSQITQMKADINLRVQKSDVVNQINISPEGILIDGQKVHITGLTRIDNAVIKDAMIADIKADKITAGTLNAANVNVVNFNANNITTGTIKGANLSMNLNTGEVVFQRGRIHSSSNNIDINVDQGYISTANLQARAILKNGELQLVEPTFFDTSTDPYLQISNGMGAGSWNGANIIGRDYIMLSNRANSGGFLIDPIDKPEDFAGIAVGKSDTGGWQPTKIGGATRGVKIRGGTAFKTPYMMFKSSPEILVGNGPNGADDRIRLSGNYIHILSAYEHTASGSANLIVAGDGALVRSTSASKYKTDIIRTNTPDYGEKLLELPTATWTDIAETKRYRDDPATQMKPTRNFGMIAEDLADAGLEMLVVRGTDGELEGINYDRIGPALIPVIAKLKNEVEILKRKLEEKTA